MTTQTMSRLYQSPIWRPSNAPPAFPCGPPGDNSAPAMPRADLHHLLETTDHNLQILQMLLEQMEMIQAEFARGSVLSAEQVEALRREHEHVVICTFNRLQVLLRAADQAKLEQMWPLNLTPLSSFMREGMPRARSGEELSRQCRGKL